MAASDNQDFVTYSGDTVVPVFTVRNSAGTAVDISSVNNIIWSAKLAEGSAVLLTKTKVAAQIAFVTDGTNGQFQVTLAAADTILLAAAGTFFIHIAQVVDSQNDVTTVTIGRMQVGLPPRWTYDPSQLASSTLYQVRDLIGDTYENDQLLLDGEVNIAITSYSNNIYTAGAECCRKIATRYARQVDTVQGELKTNYSNRSRQYATLARDLEQRGLIRGAGSTPYAGGISVDDKTTQVEDTDRVPPQFNLMMSDNLLPVGPVGNQTPTPGSPDGDGFPV